MSDAKPPPMNFLFEWSEDAALFSVRFYSNPRARRWRYHVAIEINTALWANDKFEELDAAKEWAHKELGTVAKYMTNVHDRLSPHDLRDDEEPPMCGESCKRWD